jgi:hypothetical protein
MSWQSRMTPYRPGNTLGTVRAKKGDAPWRAYERTHPATSERTYTDEECRYLRAVEAYRATYGRKFLTAVDHLQVAKKLGYLEPPGGAAD